MYPKEFFKKNRSIQKIDYFRFRELVPDLLAESVVYWRCPLFSLSVYRIDRNMVVLQLIEHYRYRGEEQHRPFTWLMPIAIASFKVSECVDWYLRRNLFLSK